MGDLKLNTDSIRYIALFESTTGARVMDCIVDDDNGRVIYLVKNGDMGMAIGKGGEHINKLKKSIGKHVEIFEYCDDVETFVRNISQPASINGMKIVMRNGKKAASISVPDTDTRSFIGKNGKNIERMKTLLHRHYNINDVIIE
ncbi:MAG: NusA-like transcription termination signal-binding factor [Methanosarcinales archaeon]|nr:NusA-like transcription termination signal-binding factor [Methanosarcinales archaeon]